MDLFLYIILAVIIVGLGIVIALLMKRSGSSHDTSVLSEKSKLEGLNEELQRNLEALRKELSDESQEKDRLLSENSGLHERNKNLQEQLENQKEDLVKLQEKFKLEFENLATKILKQSTDNLSESNKDKLKELLDPLKTKITEFQTRVENNQKESLEWNTKLKTIVEDLSTKNEKLSEEASNLVSALKGENKTQGNWGELVLERVLQMAGLHEGEEYQREYTTKNARGETIRMDAVVFLPDDKHLIIDSKVSLNAYTEYSKEDDPDRRKSLLQQHLISIRTHIKNLSDKAYPTGLGLDTPEIVLMFVPIEHGFELAMHEDQGLYEYAYNRNIVIVSAATLLATLKTVASIWQQEKQNRNVLLIAEEAGKMYDKFVGFTETMLGIGKAIEKASSEYDKGMKQLRDGTGDLLTRAQKIKALGAKANKSLPSELTQLDINEDSAE